MKRLTRVLPVLLIAMLALLPVLPAFAQGGGNPLCSGLSDADCQIIETANSTIGTVTSFATPSWEIRFNFSDGTQKVAFNAKGSGAFSFAGGQLLVHLVIDSASVEAPDSPTQSFAGEAILTNDMAYVMYNGEWYGQAITPEDLSSLGLGDVTSLGDLGNMVGATGSTDVTSAIDLTGVVTTTRGADGDAMGQKTAEFSSSLDIAKLLTAVLSSPLLGQALGAAGGAETDLGLGQMTPEDMQMMGMFLSPLLANTTLNLNLSIGLDDSYFHKIELVSNVNLDLSMLSPETGTITGEIYFMTEIANQNQPVEVTAPESYKPMDELQGALDSLGLSM